MSYQEIPTTRPPHLEFVYRLRVHMDPMNIDVGAPHGAGFSRMVMNIKGGTLRGPGLEGTIVEHGGADWGTAVEGSKYVRLDARYVVRMNTGHYICITAKGGFQPGLGKDFQFPNVSQNEVEWFTSNNIEAGGNSPFNWLNGLVIVGALTMDKGDIIIDAYRLTNFPGHEVPNVLHQST